MSDESRATKGTLELLVQQLLSGRGHGCTQLICHAAADQDYSSFEKYEGLSSSTLLVLQFLPSWNDKETLAAGLNCPGLGGVSWNGRMSAG